MSALALWVCVDYNLGSEPASIAQLLLLLLLLCVCVAALGRYIPPSMAVCRTQQE